jgi:dihydroorotase
MIALRGGHLCDPRQGWDGPADLYLAEGRVLAVQPAGAPPPAPPGGAAWEAWDCRGLLVTPGPIDTCCCLSLARDPWREDAQALAEAAAAGGWTAVVVSTGSADPDVIARLASLPLPVRLLPLAAATVGEGLSDMGALAEAGAVAVGAADAWIADAARMRAVLTYAAGVGLPVVLAPQDPALARGGVMHEGVLSLALGLRGVPAAAEVVAVARDVILQAAFGGRLHFAALSCAASLPHLGGGATAGVQAAHLLLTAEAVRGYDTAAKLSPPLREPADRAALLEAVRRGDLVLASGHRAVPAEGKACEYDYAEFGGSALETALAVGLECLSPTAFAQACAAGPAAALGLPGGRLAPGDPADVAAFDPRGSWEVPPAGLRSGGGGTPLAGRRLRGRARLTVVGGRVVFQAGDLARDCINMQQ